MTNNDIYDTAIAAFRYQGIRMTDFETLAAHLHVPVSTVCERFASSKDVLVLSTVRFEIEREYGYVNSLFLSLSPLRFIDKLYVHAMRFFHSFHSSFFKDLKHYHTIRRQYKNLIVTLLTFVEGSTRHCNPASCKDYAQKNVILSCFLLSFV